MGIEQSSWEERIQTALAGGNVDDAAQALLESPILPAMRRQLQDVFPKIPPSYIDDSVGDAVSEAFVRLTQNASSIDAKKLPGYIYKTAHHMLQAVVKDLRARGEVIDPEQSPYDPDLTAGIAPLGAAAADPAVRRSAVLYSVTY